MITLIRRIDRFDLHAVVVRRQGIRSGLASLGSLRSWGRSRYALVFALVFAGTLACSAPALAGQPRPDLVIPSNGPVEAKVNLGKPETTAYLTVLNAGGKAARVHVSFQASSSEEIKAKVPPLTVIQSKHAARLEVKFTGLKGLTKVASGELIVAGGPKPVAQSATVTAEAQPVLDWPPWIVGGSLGVAALLMAIVAGHVAGKKSADGKRLLFGPAPGPKWSFEGLASKLTAVGALLGTVLSAATLPSVSVQISKESLVALSLLFAGLTVAGPFVFEAIRRPGGQGTVAEAMSEADKTAVDALLPNWGFTWGLLIACWLILSAVLGELTTLGLAVWVITGENAGSILIEIGLGFLVLFATYYVVVTAWVLTSVDWRDIKKKVDEKTTETPVKSTIKVQPGAKAPKKSGEIADAPMELEPGVYDTNRHKAREEVDLAGGRRATRHVDFGPDVTAPRLSLRLP